MLFLATHSHTPEQCLVDEPELVRGLLDDGHVAAAGLKVVASYIAPPEHDIYFVLDVSDYSQVVRFFRPLMKRGTLRAVPVQPVQEALGVLGGGR